MIIIDEAIVKHTAKVSTEINYPQSSTLVMCFIQQQGSTLCVR